MNTENSKTEFKALFNLSGEVCTMCLCKYIWKHYFSRMFNDLKNILRLELIRVKYFRK